MRPRPSVLVPAYAVAEAALLVWFAGRFGAAVLIWLLVAGLLLGMLVMRVAGLSAGASLARAARRSDPVQMRAADGTEQVVLAGSPTPEEMRRTAHQVGSSALLFVAGLLLATPGIISDVAGLLLLLPAVRTRVGRRVAGSLQGQRPATVVTVDPAAPDVGQPPVIIGEILPPPRYGEGNTGNNADV